MVCALPTALVDEAGAGRPCAYLYAVCTAPTHREKGLCRRLMAYAETQEAARGAVFAALVPSGEALFRFYGGMGYRTAFFHREYTVHAAPQDGDVRSIGPKDYGKLRESHLSGRFLSYRPEILVWQQALSRRTGAELYQVETDGVRCCAAAERTGPHLLLKELLPDVPAAARLLAARLGCATATVRTEGTGRPFGMIKALSGLPAPDRAYLGLAFD